MRNLLAPIYEKVGGLNWHTKSHLINTNLKTIITKYACLYNVSDCQERAINYFKELIEAPNAASRFGFKIMDFFKRIENNKFSRI